MVRYHCSSDPTDHLEVQGFDRELIDLQVKMFQSASDSEPDQIVSIILPPESVAALAAHLEEWLRRQRTGE